MKKLTIAVSIMLALAPVMTSAKSSHPIRIETVSSLKELQKKCHDPQPILYGCFFDGRNDIYLSPDLTEGTGFDSYTFTLLHELGHYYLQNETDFSLFYQKDRNLAGQWIDPQEHAANEFARWRLNPASVPATEATLFRRVTSLH